MERQEKWNKRKHWLKCHLNFHEWDKWIFLDPGLCEVPIGHFKKRKCKHCNLTERMHGIHTTYCK